jgi:hypothetical protein
MSSLVYFNDPLNVTSQNILAHKSSYTDADFLKALGMDKLIALLGNYNNSYYDFNIAAFDAQWYSAASAYAEYSTSPVTISDYKNSFTQFCMLNQSTICSMVTFNSFDNYGYTVNPFKYQLVNGSCSSSFLISKDAW